MANKHTDKIIKSFQEIKAITPHLSEAGQTELFHILWDMYTFSYEAADTECRERTYYFYPETIDKNDLLQKCINA